jgi:hypothetical protein
MTTKYFLKAAYIMVCRTYFTNPSGMGPDKHCAIENSGTFDVQVKKMMNRQRTQFLTSITIPGCEPKSSKKLNICLMVSFGVTSTTHEVHCKLADVWIF